MKFLNSYAYHGFHSASLGEALLAAPFYFESASLDHVHHGPFLELHDQATTSTSPNQHAETVNIPLQTDLIELPATLDRKYLIRKRTITSTGTAGSNFLDIDLVSAYTGVVPTETLYFGAYWRPSFEITIVVNSSPVHYGRAVFGAFPNYKTLSTSQYTTYPTIWTTDFHQIDFTGNNTISFVVPYTHFKTKIPLNDSNYGVRLKGYIAMPLRCTTNDAASADISIFARLIDPQINVLHPPDDYYLQSGFANAPSTAHEVFGEIYKRNNARAALFMKTARNERVNVVRSKDSSTQTPMPKVDSSTQASDRGPTIGTSSTNPEVVQSGEISNEPNQSSVPEVTGTAGEEGTEATQTTASGSTAPSEGVVTRVFKGIQAASHPSNWIMATGRGLQATGQLMSLAGYSTISSSSQTFPIQNRQPYIGRAQDVPAAKVLAPYPHSTVDVDHTIMGGTVEEDCLATYVSRPSMILIKEIPATYLADTAILVMPVHPAMNINNDSTFPGFAARVASLFDMWRGSIRYTFSFVCPALTTARFGLAYLPYAGTYKTLDTISSELLNRGTAKFIDVRGNTDYSIEIPFDGSTYWKSTTIVTGENQNQYAIGSLVLFMVNAVAAGGTAASIYLQVFHSMSPHDAEFALPNTYDPFTYKFESGFEQVQNVVSPALHAKTLQHADFQSVFASPQNYREEGINSAPGKCMTFSALAKILSPATTFESTSTTPFTKRVTPFSGPSWNAAFTGTRNYLARVCQLFRWMRGSARVYMSHTSQQPDYLYHHAMTAPLRVTRNGWMSDETTFTALDNDFIVSAYSTNGFGKDDPIDYVVPWVNVYPFMPTFPVSSLTNFGSAFLNNVLLVNFDTYFASTTTDKKYTFTVFISGGDDFCMGTYAPLAPVTASATWRPFGNTGGLVVHA